MPRRKLDLTLGAVVRAHTVVGRKRPFIGTIIEIGEGEKYFILQAKDGTTWLREKEELSLPPVKPKPKSQRRKRDA